MRHWQYGIVTIRYRQGDIHGKEQGVDVTACTTVIFTAQYCISRFRCTVQKAVMCFFAVVQLCHSPFQVPLVRRQYTMQLVVLKLQVKIAFWVIEQRSHKADLVFTQCFLSERPFSSLEGPTFTYATIREKLIALHEGRIFFAEQQGVETEEEKRFWVFENGNWEGDSELYIDCLV